MSAYIRACNFSVETKRRKKRPKNVIEDKKAAAEALALLGQSRIASNLNQLAHHANISALTVGAVEKEQFAEANAHLAAIRGLLMQALGKAHADSGQREANSAASRVARTHSSPDASNLIRKRGA
ncbi:MAG: plasmid mobilization relaxosome protein MobC [Rhodobacteraceae bacterium]|nr:plasmid mobilization relaxosome protein MobC [Paracoccaceae bacterium]